MSNSLMEVLVTFILLTILTVLINEATFIQLKTTKAHYYFNSAMIEINSFNEELRLFKIFNKNIIENWQKNIAIDLPQGKSKIFFKGPIKKVAVSWGNADCGHNHWGISGCLIENI